jgi:hypothetical protein
MAVVQKFSFSFQSDGNVKLRMNIGCNKLRMKYRLKSTNIDIARVRNFEVIYDIFNIVRICTWVR